VKQYHHFINGEYKPSLHGGTMDIFNPATGLKYATIASGDAADVQLAYNAAKNAADGWACTPLATRQAILQKIANLIEEKAELLAQAEMEDTGKPIALARRLDSVNRLV
jgi:acyl-CoA reductase-like NAD-dependent aldehyde dehydrogenase